MYTGWAAMLQTLYMPVSVSILLLMYLQAASLLLEIRLAEQSAQDRCSRLTGPAAGNASNTSSATAQGLPIGSLVQVRVVHSPAGILKHSSDCATASGCLSSTLLCYVWS